MECWHYWAYRVWQQPLVQERELIFQTTFHQVAPIEVQRIHVHSKYIVDSLHKLAICDVMLFESERAISK